LAQIGLDTQQSSEAVLRRIQGKTIEIDQMATDSLTNLEK